MNFTAKPSLKPLVAGIAMLGLPLGYSQIPEQEIESIFSRLNGDDYDVRYDARMDLQDAVTSAGAPGSDGQPALVEAQLLERLKNEPLLTTRLWILRQLHLIGTDASIDTLESLLISDSRELVNAVKMTLQAISGEQGAGNPLKLPEKLNELLDALDEADNEAIQSAIYEKIAQRNPRQAEAILLASPLPEYIRTAATSKRSRLVRAAMGLLDSSDVATQIVVLGALDDKIPSRVEKQMIELLDSESETLTIQTLEALGRVGSAKCLDAVLALSGARSRDIRESAIDTLAAIQDPRIDRSLFTAARKGDAVERAKAVKALSFRASEGIAQLVNQFAADPNLDIAIREEAIAAMEIVGNAESLPVLIEIVLAEDASGLRKDAQKVLKRMTLRTADAEAAWAAFKTGFDKADQDAMLALMLVADSAPTEEMVSYLMNAYETGDSSIQKMVIRVLPSWRNWDGGNALLTIAERADSDEMVRSQAFKGIGRLILGSDGNYPIEGKYALGNAAFEVAKTDDEKKAVLGGFRYFSGSDKRYLNRDELDVAPEIVDAINNAQRK